MMMIQIVRCNKLTYAALSECAMKSLLLQIVIFGLSVLFVVTADNDINSAVKSPNSDKESHESSGCDEHDKK